MGPGHAVWALQAVWIWLPGWSLQVCLGWAGSVQAKWCEALSCILRSGGAKNDLGRFCGMSNFQDESLNMKIILRAKRQKQKDAMFSLSRRSIFNNSELGSQTYEIIGFFPARMRNIVQLIRWMEFLSQKNRLSNWSGARHSRAFWELSRA